MAQARTLSVDCTAQIASHRLRPLLEPRSIALVGASPRQESIGNKAARALLASGFSGRVDFVNPYHGAIEGEPCAGSLDELEAPPDLAILNVGAARLEGVLEGTIRAGARSAVIFDTCNGNVAGGMPLLDRLRDMARDAGIPVCGGNGMGFFNVPHRAHASFYSANDLKPGGISLIAHSGSVFTVLALNDPRYRFDLAISPGQEIGAALDEYIDYAARRPTTRVIALFMEAARNPQKFMAALETARAHGKPVVVCKVGRTSESAELALSHSGAMAGSGTAYDAMLERCGALSVATVDQLLNTAMLLAQGREMTGGEAAAVTDSGGLRELFIDRAKSRSIPLATLSEQTKSKLAARLPAGLHPSNPLDCAGDIDDDFHTAFQTGLEILANAPEVGMLGYEIDARDNHVYRGELVAIAKQLPQITTKPCFVYSSFSQTNNRSLSDRLADTGVPSFNGLDETLSAIQNLRRLRELRVRLRSDDPLPPETNKEIAARWREALRPGQWLGEAQGLAMLSAFGISTITCETCANWQEVNDAARRIGYPVVLKTAAMGIAHKSDVGGVIVGIRSSKDLRAAYDQITRRLGSEVLVQNMATPGFELAFGYTRDPDFGPLVMVSAGGTLIETLDDRRHALAPFGRQRAAEMIGELNLSALLAGTRGSAPVDVNGLAQALSAFSAMCATLSDRLVEADINPVIVGQNGVIAVDALMVTDKP